MNRVWIYVLGGFGLGVLVYGICNWHGRALRFYNSFSSSENVGLMTQAQEFITHRLSHVTVDWIDARESPALDALELVKSGKLDGAITVLYYWGTQDPTFYLVSSYPFLYNGFFQFQLWRSERGHVLYDQLGERHNIVIIPCGVTGIQLCG